MFTFGLTVLLTIFHLGFHNHPVLSSASLTSAWDLLCNTCRGASQNCDPHLCGIWDELYFRSMSLFLFQISKSAWVPDLGDLPTAIKCRDLSEKNRGLTIQICSAYFWTIIHHSMSPGKINRNNNLTFCKKDCYGNKQPTEERLP